MSTPPEPRPGKFAATITLGPKGQIVIPKAARDLCGIQPGDSVLLLADAEQGIGIVRHELFEEFIATALGGAAQPPTAPNDAQSPTAQHTPKVEP
ncbi:AbrB/MazE/SpoVT family DNA-binding domain-containing protein [Actinomyces ruminicola]|uniref:Looped-hinge helix DNA binding domain-containing protein, AbrB family n=1 Tax=Actinomyces ruminicola TaxID=332524 RepID=A0A1G9XWZ1_9ACTO|nr:AbrB/MazE/SpoVT family DNA-binding domain-containing protein [Actinomyces ruminicola]MBE6475608.1 AbrB family transcriptional regulator [Actinomyces succiniciruminis]SDN00773.1 looped-hinge helix DNA binding domain-containing protein, AbrB family [Actinomyces ruminicola]